MILLLVGIPFRRPLMSIGGIVLVVNWFLEGRMLEKWRKIKSNRILFFCLLFFIIYLFGLIYTENFNQAWKTIWLKIPLFFIPVIFTTSKSLSIHEFHNLLKVYLIGVLISTIYGYSIYHLNHLIDKREMAVFISYIRFEMNICFAIFVSAYLMVHETYKWQRFMMLIPLLWCIYLLIYIGALTAIIIFFLVIIMLVIKHAIEKDNIRQRFIIPLFLTLFIGSIGIYSYILIKQYYTVTFNIVDAETHTSDNHLYKHDTSLTIIENGSYVFTYVCEEELEHAWQQRSDIPYYGRDQNGQHGIRTTLIRFLNSKGLRKDRQGVEALTDDDIYHIEKGIANEVYVHPLGLKARLYSLLWELSDYKHTGNITGYTLPQRFELWKNAVELIKQNPVLGVGTGDIKDAFANQLQVSDSPLQNANKLSHNQFLLFLFGFGILGFVLICISVLYPLIQTKRFKHDLFYIFLCIVFFAMMTDDTFERQDGLTFFAFFYFFFLFLMPYFDQKQGTNNI